MRGWLDIAWPYAALFAAAGVALVASSHAILHKRDVRAALAWTGIIWLVPLAGAALYALLGVNRIQRKAARLRGDMARYHLPPPVPPLRAADVREVLPGRVEHLSELARAIGKVTTRPLLSGNRVKPLLNGDEAYPVMLEAIEQAQRSVSLLSYIFDHDQIGGRFADALCRARERGVEVRVLVDAAGVGLLARPIDRELRHRGVNAARFMSAWRPRRAPYLNLRSHRKILVVDGSVGFTGGMNIHDGNVLHDVPADPVSDVHFKVEGPVVMHLQEVFAEDWQFSTEESLSGEAWFPELECVGDTLARAIADGPDEDFEMVRWTVLSALACARSSVRVVTPYFLPDQTVITAIRVALLRGINVEVIVPERSDIRVVDWACRAQLGQMLEAGCRVWLSPPPFDHSKLMVVDGQWVLLGSANWDPRSLRLNFEFCLECYDAMLARDVVNIIADKKARAQPLTVEHLETRGLAIRLRDAAARLLSPYL